MEMKEIGGYLEFEKFNGSHYHEKAIKVNCGRVALLYILKLRNIKNIYVPDYMCDVIFDTCIANNVNVLKYKIDANFAPDWKELSPTKNDWLFFADYFGQAKEKDYKKALELFKGNIIIDECQNFFKSPWNNSDTIYSCRKYFGVSDGGYVITRNQDNLNIDIEKDTSLRRIKYLIGRYEKTAREYFHDAQLNNENFDNTKIFMMSKFTDNMLNAINYDRIIKQRTENFRYLHNLLSDINKLKLVVPEGPFMYPLLLDDVKDIRPKLADLNIFIPTLWPNVLKTEPKDSYAYNFAKNILPLPIDQRYNTNDMELIIKEVTKCLK